MQTPSGAPLRAAPPHNKLHGDGGIDQIASQRSEAGKCPLLVGPGKLAESDHIRRKKAASFRVSAMVVPPPHARLARLLIGLYRLWVQHLVQHLLGVAKIISARSRPAEFFAKGRPSSLLQRMIEPDEIANLVAYLASPLSSATNGAALRVDGGVTPTIG